MVYPLTWTWPRHREFQERVWAGIVRWRPIYIVIARNPWSLVRSPSADPFFEEHLTELAERAYRFEAALPFVSSMLPRALNLAELISATDAAARRTDLPARIARQGLKATAPP